LGHIPGEGYADCPYCDGKGYYEEDNDLDDYDDEYPSEYEMEFMKGMIEE
jgi:hypothetical protein